MEGRRAFGWRRKRVPPEGDDVYGETYVDVLGITMKHHDIFQKGTSPKADKNPLIVTINSDPRDDLPDVRDGLTHRERIVLQCLKELQEERGGRHVPTAMLYGTVVEYIDMSVE